MHTLNAHQAVRRPTQGLLEAVSLEVVRKLRLASEAEAKDDRETILEEIFCDVTGLLDDTAQSQLGACGPVPYYQVLAAYYATPKGADTAVALLHLLQGLYGQGYASPLVALLLHRWLLLRRTGRQAKASGTALRALPEEQRARLVHVVSLGSTQLFLGDVHRVATAFKPLWSCLAYEVVLGLPATNVPGAISSSLASCSPAAWPQEEVHMHSSNPLSGMSLPAKTGLLAAVAAFMVYYADKEQLSDLLRWFPAPTSLPPPGHVLLQQQQHSRRSVEPGHDRDDSAQAHRPAAQAMGNDKAVGAVPQQAPSTPTQQHRLVRQQPDSAAAATRQAADTATQHAARVAAAAASAAGSQHDNGGAHHDVDSTSAVNILSQHQTASADLSEQQEEEEERCLSTLSAVTTTSSLGEDEDESRAWQWRGLDFIVLEIVDMLQRIRSEAGLVHYLAGVTLLKGQPFLVIHLQHVPLRQRHRQPSCSSASSQADAARARQALSTSARLKLQGSLYSLSTPGGPHYPPRSVQAAAVTALDELFPTGRTSRAVVRTLFRLLHPADWLGDVVSGPVAAVQGLTSRLAVTAFMTLHRLLVFSGGAAVNRRDMHHTSAHDDDHDDDRSDGDHRHVDRESAGAPITTYDMSTEPATLCTSHDAAAGTKSQPEAIAPDALHVRQSDCEHGDGGSAPADNGSAGCGQRRSWASSFTSWLPAGVTGGGTGRLLKAWQQHTARHKTTTAGAGGGQQADCDGTTHVGSSYGMPYHTPPGAAHGMPTT